MRVIRAAEFKETRWRNGMGLSWDIASDPPAIEDFGWRFAIARIDADVPFSHYPNTDRVFTLIDGQGLDLDFDGGKTLAVARRFMPNTFACDVPAFCRLRDGPCRALNLFTQRGMWTAAADVVSGATVITQAGPILLFALEGVSRIDDQMLDQGDAAIALERVDVSAAGALLYAARLTKA